MSYADMNGSHFVPSRTWIPQVEFSPDNTGWVPNEELIVDPYLPAVGIDPFDPAGAIVIAQGRFVSVGYTNGRGASNYRITYTDTGKTALTLHDGKNLTPAGMSINRMYKDVSTFMAKSNVVKYKKGFIAEVPHVLSINNAHGTLYAGDRVTGYWGSTTSTSQFSHIHRGKPVKWTAKKLYVTSTSASALVNLSSAVYPGMTPRVVATFAAGSLLTAVTATLSFNGSVWSVSYTGTGSGTVTEVWYEYGQDSDQIAGEVTRIQSLSDMLSRDDYLRWVEYAPNDTLNYPPAATRYPVTAVSQETPTTVVSGSQYRTEFYPISVHHAVLVEIKGTILDKDGVSTTYTDWYALPTTALLDARGYFVGLYHNVNWRTGLIELGANISSLTAIRVTYSYITDPRDGAAVWGAGIINLTDGRNTNQSLANGGAGIQPHLNFADVVGGMRVLVY
jgi:hypothetical protein